MREGTRIITCVGQQVTGRDSLEGLKGKHIKALEAVGFEWLGTDDEGDEFRGNDSISDEAKRELVYSALEAVDPELDPVITFSTDEND